VNLDAVAFSKRWVDAWNAHDVEAVVEHFHEEVVFTSPVAASVLPETAGLVRASRSCDVTGRCVAAYSEPAFAVEDVYVGVDTIVIAYRNQDVAGE